MKPTAEGTRARRGNLPRKPTARGLPRGPRWDGPRAFPRFPALMALITALSLKLDLSRLLGD